MISAIEPGAEYNIALDDLKITGFPAVIARTITPISGGASGDEFIFTVERNKIASVDFAGKNSSK